LLIDNQKFDRTSKQFLNKICEYFVTIGASMSKKFSQTDNLYLKLYSKRSIKSFIFHEISEEEVSTCISNIKTYSAHGPDEIPSKFVKLANKVLTSMLTKLFNKCIQLETFSDNFKKAHVIPLPKVSSPKTLSDFRPISLLSIFSKLFEKLIETKMMKFINKNKLLTPSQYGFRVNSSTELAITTFYDKLLRNINNKKITCSIFLDLKKAFDSVNHNILLQK